MRPLPGTLNLWRISNHADLLGTGGMIASARWHTAGKPVVYLAENPASALLEVLVHLELDAEHVPATYQLLKIEAGPDLAHDEVSLASLSPDWQSSEAETQSKGDAWLRSRTTALLRVPSAIVPETWNWMLNPRHPDAGRVKIQNTAKHSYDLRLFQP